KAGGPGRGAAGSPSGLRSGWSPCRNACRDRIGRCGGGSGRQCWPEPSQQWLAGCHRQHDRPVEIAGGSKMNFSALFIRRPVLSTVLALLILLLGFQGLFNLQVRQYPEVEETVITITTVYPGASAELIQGFITSPISSAVSTTENVDYVTSQSRPSASVVTVQMQLGSNPDIALTEVMSKVQQVRSQLPGDAE